MKNNKIAIVTGGAGFIGSHMVDLLLSKNFKVKVIDNLISGKRENFSHNKKNKNFFFTKKDILRLNKTDKIFKNADYVFHFAGIASLVPSIEEPVKYLNTNTLGTAKVLEASRYNKIKKFIYAASASCYGKTYNKVTEKNKINIENPYALSKFLGEKTALEWSKIYNLPVISLRIFNAYGERSLSSGIYGSVIGNFLKQKNSDKPLTIVGDGNQSRDFIYVEDIAKAFLRAAKSKYFTQVYNLGTGKDQKINYLAKLISDNKIHIKNRPNETRKSCANISKIKKHLKWMPNVRFEDGIKKIL
jgi:UDP-glucose 4-epimerase